MGIKYLLSLLDKSVAAIVNCTITSLDPNVELTRVVIFTKFIGQETVLKEWAFWY